MPEANNILSYKEWLLTQPFSLNISIQYYEYQNYVKKIRGGNNTQY